MMKLFCQLVSKLFERTLKKTASPHLLFGDHQITTFISQNTSLTSFRNCKDVERLINYYGVQKFEKIGEHYGVSILIINGAPWAVDSEFAKRMEECIYDKERSETRVKKDDRDGV